MNPDNLHDLSNLSMLELFRVEAESQAALMTSGLLELERGAAAPDQLETLMRAAHSLKGAARIVNLQLAVTIAHAMEDCFVAAQKGKLALGQTQIDALFRGVDLLLHISKRNEDDISQWEAEHAAEIQQLLEALKLLIAQEKPAIGSPAGPAKPLISAEALVPADSGKAAPVCVEVARLALALRPPHLSIGDRQALPPADLDEQVIGERHGPVDREVDRLHDERPALAARQHLEHVGELARQHLPLPHGGRHELAGLLVARRPGRRVDDRPGHRRLRRRRLVEHMRGRQHGRAVDLHTVHR